MAEKSHIARQSAKDGPYIGHHVSSEAAPLRAALGGRGPTSRRDRGGNVFAALGDPTRLRLVARLGSDGPLSTVTLGEGTDMTRQALTKHLVALEDAGLVEGTHGRPRVWRLRPRRLEEARRSLERISQQWDDALDRLKAFVEE